MNKYSDLVCDWLDELGYTHCFFVPGGNSMHLLDGMRQKFVCVPFVHEMSATIAAEYFNQVSVEGKALVLLTAGPGLTNAITGIAGAFHEGRELLVIGGQVKSTDLSDGSIRQRGIQEVDGVRLVEPVTVKSERLAEPISREDFLSLVQTQWSGTPGPVFIEMCLDVQGAVFEDAAPSCSPNSREYTPLDESPSWAQLRELLDMSSRPIVLIGGGVRREDVGSLLQELDTLGVPLMTTYNGSDRVPSDHRLYFGRPNTWGMRYSNLLVGQCDLLIALGTRLGLQQTGFNWQSFVPQGKIVHVDVSEPELMKGHPRTHLKICADANQVLRFLVQQAWVDRSEWVSYCEKVKQQLPLSESFNSRHDGFHNPYDFLAELSNVAVEGDLIVPCSSGGAFTAFYQAFLNKRDQKIVSNKSLASMGYGLAGAIGAAIAYPDQRVLHIEGDGGFSQNLQELATVNVRKLPIKTFLWCNDGYASIRMTQKNYFGGQYLGCDIDTGLGFPDWGLLGDSFGIAVETIDPGFSKDPDFLTKLCDPNPYLFLVRLAREQTFLPKISSRITESGSMESEPLWQISPHLSEEILNEVGHYLPK